METVDPEMMQAAACMHDAEQACAGKPATAHHAPDACKVPFVFSECSVSHHFLASRLSLFTSYRD